mgnify:CR=1 FL=1
MKKLIRGILAVSAMAAALALTGCDKKNGTTTGGDTTFAGEYRMEAKPLYSEMEAKDPNATAIEMEGMNMTYAQIIAALFSLTQSADLGGTSDITFQPDGSMVIVFDDPEDGTVTLLPNEAEGIPADAITYALNGSNVIFTLSSETIDNMLDAATDPQELPPSSSCSPDSTRVSSPIRQPTIPPRSPSNTNSRRTNSPSISTRG